MSLRGQTGDIVTRYLVNDRALEAIIESEQFCLPLGKDEAIECRTTAAFGVRAVAVLGYMTLKHPQESVLVDQEWARFQQLVKEWHAQCGTTSSPIEMAMCPAYQKIIALGKPAVPLILKQLQLEGDDPDHWFWALHYLTDADPVAPKDRGNLRKMRAAWLQWGRNNLLV